MTLRLHLRQVRGTSSSVPESLGQRDSVFTGTREYASWSGQYKVPLKYGYQTEGMTSRRFYHPIFQIFFLSNPFPLLKVNFAV